MKRIIAGLALVAALSRLGVASASAHSNYVTPKNSDYSSNF